MNYRVRYSAWSWFLTIISIVLIVSMSIYWFKDGQMDLLWVMLVIFGSAGVLALIYSPVSLSVDHDVLTINRVLFKKRIPLAEIESVRLFSPTMGARRIAASGGWFGYWGWFYEADIGRYFAYYGRSSDCFLLTLRSGRKYVLGCEYPYRILGELDIIS